MIKYLHYIIIIIFFFPLHSYSFEGLPEVPGNIIVPLSKSNIKLSNLMIDVDDGYIVKSKFELNNASEKKEQIVVGFPLKNHYLYRYLEPQYFRVKTNNKSLTYSVKRSDEYNMPNISDKYDYLYVWHVTINPKNKIIIECTYEMNWHVDDPGVNRAHFTFHLKDASLWKGLIDKANIKINLPRDDSDLLNRGKINIGIEPTGYYMDNNQSIEWHFKNWEPKNNILIEINPLHY